MMSDVSFVHTMQRSQLHILRYSVGFSLFLLCWFTAMRLLTSFTICSFLPKKGELGAAAILAMEHGHYLLFIKSIIMRKAMNDLKSWLDTPPQDLESELIFKELIKIEIIATTVHYAEVFAATLLGMRRYRRFHKYLQEYSQPQITNFYKRIASRKLPYIMKLLQYPPLEQIRPEASRQQFIDSATLIHGKLKELAQFYLKWHEFYNTYKHGMRLFAGKPNPYEDFTVIGYLLKKQPLDSITVVRADDEVEKARILCQFMFGILHNSESVYVHGKLLKEKQFQTRIFVSKQKHSS